MTLVIGALFPAETQDTNIVANSRVAKMSIRFWSRSNHRRGGEKADPFLMGVAKLPSARKKRTRLRGPTFNAVDPLARDGSPPQRKIAFANLDGFHSKG